MSKKLAEDKKKGSQNNSLVDILRRFRNSIKLASSELYGTDEKLYDDNNLDLIDIKNSIQTVRMNYSEKTGEDIIDLFNSLSLNNQNNKGNNSYLLGLNNKKNGKKEIIDVRNLLDNQESFNINEMFSQEVGRLQAYSNYELIYDNIPQAAQALDTFVDNILSPDDFTKSIFNIYINDIIMGSIEDDINSEFNKITERCKKILENYKFETLTSKIITEALKLGDCFTLVLPLNREIEKLTLSENNNPFNIPINEVPTNKLTSKDIIITEEELNELGSLLINNEFKKPEKPILQEGTNVFESNNNRIEYNKNLNIYNEDMKKYNDNVEHIKHDIAEIINNNFIFNENSDLLLEDNYSFYSDFAVKHPKDLFNSVGTKTTSDKKYNKTNYKKKSKVTVNGAIVKILKPSRVIKLTADEVEFGYLYIENLENGPDIMTSGAYSLTNNLFNTMKPLHQNENPDVMNAKYKLITDVFVKNISKKLDIKFINKHPEFKRTIYNLLKQDYIINKQVRVTYLTPTDVVHFGKGNEEYYDSIYKKILFTAKLYLAVLTSQVMLKLVRSPDKRVFYIEVDLDNDTEAVVQSFMRDVKTKDIKMSNFGQDINTLLNSVGVFNDYYIPVVDGNKPLEIDTLSGMNAEVTNDFLEYLLKALISGLGLPPEYLSYSEQTEFARSLGMMNGKFVRSIIMYQKIFGEQFTKLFRKIYEYEYLEENVIAADKKRYNQLNNITKNIDGDDKTEVERSAILNKNVNQDENFDVNIITIKFPSPQALNISTLNEQVNSFKEIIDFIVAVMVPEDDDKLTGRFRRTLTQDMLSNFDWNKYNDILKEARVEKTDEELDSLIKDNMGNSSDSGF